MSPPMLRDFGRTVMAEELGRPLSSTELVHHKDENHFNHDLDNLQLVSRAEHVCIHKPVKGYKFTDEQRRKLSESHKGIRHSMQTRLNMSKTRKGRSITWGDKISQAKIKLRKEEVLTFLQHHPNATIADTKKDFKLKSHGPISRLGGLRNLKKEVNHG